MNIKQKIVGYSEQSMQTVITFILLIVIASTASLLVPNFFTWNNINNIFIQNSLIVITGCAVTLLIISGNLDLSVGGIVAQSGVLYAYFCMLEIPTIIAMFLGVLSGTVIGLINAFLVEKMKIPPVLATIGTMYISRGIAYIFADGSMIEAGLPVNFRAINMIFVGPISLILVIVILFIILFTIIQKYSTFGRRIYYLGVNKSTAVLSGIKTSRVVSILYIVVGTLAGFCGTVIAAKIGAGDCKVGNGFELDVISAAVIGGTDIFGGKGSILGMLFGTIILGVLNNSLNLLSLSSYTQYVIKAVVLVGAILFQRFVYKKISRFSDK